MSDATFSSSEPSSVENTEASVAASLDPATYAIWLSINGDDQQSKANREERHAFEQLQWSEEDKQIADLKTAADYELASGICGAASTACDGMSDLNASGSKPDGNWQLGSAGCKVGAAIFGEIASNDRAGATQDEQRANRDKSVADDLKSDTDRALDDKSKAFDAIRAIHDTQNQTTQASILKG